MGRQYSHFHSQSLGKKARIVVLLTAAVFALAGEVFSQSKQSGEIRGTVTDESGGVVPDVHIIITNVLTDVSQRLTTDSNGVYDAPFVPPGEYSITFERDNFKTFVRKGIVLHVETIKVDAVLEVGSVTEKVTVNALQPLVQTETADRSMTVSERVIADTPNVGRSWDELLGVLPGVNGGGGADATGQGIGVNGQTAYQSNWQIDGGLAMLGASQNPDILQPPLDTIEELDLSTANFGAERGTGLSVFNVTTKSGTNAFHGDVFEYVENNYFDARNFFAPSSQPAPALRWNEYGFTLGGPIKRNKLFFFGSFQANPTSSPTTEFFSYPTAKMRTGDFSELCQSGFGANGVCNPSSTALSVQLYDPATTVVDPTTGIASRQPFPGNIIPEGRIDPVAAAIQKYFPLPNLPGVVNNYVTNVSFPVHTKWFNGKIDYDISTTNRLSGSFMVVRQNTKYADPICEIDCITTPQQDIQAQITDTWTINPQKVNEFRFAFTREHFEADPASLGKNYPSQLGLANPAANLFPQIWIEGAFSTTIGVDAAGFGGPAVDAETTFVPSEVFTWIKGKHIFKFGGEFQRWQVNTAFPSQQEGNFDFSGLFTLNPIDQLESSPPQEGTGYADFLLGLPDAWYIYSEPVIGARSWSAQSFAQDEYKITPNLTLTLGLRWIIQSGWSEVNNKISSFNPAIMNPATDTPGAMWYAGQLGHDALTATVYDFFAPRAGFAWSPRKNTSLRGGFGVYNAFAGWNTYAAAGFAQGWAPIGSLYTTDQLTPVFQLSQGPPPVVNPTSSMRTPDLLNGQPVNYSFYHSSLGYSEEYQLSLQQQFNWGILAEVAYVGNRGIHLPYTRDINQVPENLLGPGNAQLNRPDPTYQAISAAYFDGISSYNAFQATLKKQLSDGLLLTANYTFSKTMDEITNSGFVGGGTGYAEHGGALQDQYEPRSNYGPSSLDIRQFFNGSAVYELPFGPNQHFQSQSGILNTVFGGWELSALFQVHSGLPFTPYVGSPNLTGSLSGSWRPNRVGSGTLANPTINDWFDVSAFTVPAPYTFGDSGRNFLYGPGYAIVNGALLKNFSIKKLGEKGKLQVKVEAANLLNHPNFGLPDAAINTAAVGTITSAYTARTLQLGAKIAF